MYIIHKLIASKQRRTSAFWGIIPVAAAAGLSWHCKIDLFWDVMFKHYIVAPRWCGVQVVVNGSGGVVSVG